MKLSKIVDKLKKYLNKDELKMSHEEKILDIIEELKKKKSEAKEELKEVKKSDIKKRVELQKKIDAISRLLEKSSSLL